MTEELEREVEGLKETLHLLIEAIGERQPMIRADFVTGAMQSLEGRPDEEASVLRQFMAVARARALMRQSPEHS